MSSPHLKRSVVGLAFAIGLSCAGWQGVLAQAEPLTPEHAKELYFDAARAGRVDLLEGLIKAGMDPNVRDPHGYTALILAAYNAQLQAVEVLIAKGADPCATDPDGNTALMGSLLGVRTKSRSGCWRNAATSTRPTMPDKPHS
jgi:hypothetical protein